MAEHELPVEEADIQVDVQPDAGSSTVSRSRRHGLEADLILDVLTTCASAFGLEKARFVRQTHGGRWQVHSLQSKMLITHMADHAEVAMAWAVGLSRFPIRVTRPRVTHADGGSVRPISVTSYLGIPILCTDHFVGVVELAGTFGSDIERTLDGLKPKLHTFGNRLVHDPSLRASPFIDLDCECWLDGGCWTSSHHELTENEWLLLSHLGGPTALHSIVDKVPFPENILLDTVRALVAKGLISVRASTRPLADDAAAG